MAESELGEIEKKVEEELKKEGEEVKRVSKENIEAKAMLTQSRLGSDVVRELESLESEAVERARGLEQFRQLMDEDREDMGLLTKNLLGGINPATLEKLFEKMGGSDNPFAYLMALYLLSDLQSRSMFNNMLLSEWIEDRRMRRMMMYGMGMPYFQPPHTPYQRSQQNHELLRSLEELKSTVRKLATAVRKAVSSATSPQQAMTIKDVVSAAKELLSLVRESPDKETVRAINEGLKALAQALEKAEKGKGSPQDTFRLVKETINMVKEITESVRNLNPSTAVVTTTPLQYSGKAPWVFHPDARMALKDLVNEIMRNAKDIVVAWKSAGKIPMASERKASRSVELPEDLKL